MVQFLITDPKFCCISQSNLKCFIINNLTIPIRGHIFLLAFMNISEKYHKLIMNSKSCEKHEPEKPNMSRKYLSITLVIIITNNQ